MTPETDVDLVARWIHEARSVVYVCGAGLSVPSGVRAYRSGSDALWDEYVTDWGTRAKFISDTANWWETFWLRGHAELLRTDIKPNPGHFALVELMKRGLNDLVITQNIDGLHRLSGHPDGQLIEAHGRHDRFICSSRGACAGVTHMRSWVDLSLLGQGMVPRCELCQAPIRPLVLLFDENYHDHAAYQVHRAHGALYDADVIVFVGTSFSVGITSAAVRLARGTGAKLINVNLERAPFEGVTELPEGAEIVLPSLAMALSVIQR